MHKAFTISVGDLEHLTACDYVGLVSANEEPEKMEKAGFTTTESKFIPITYDGVHCSYHRLGEKVGNAFQDGIALK